jgi:hypothetical protein
MTECRMTKDQALRFLFAKQGFLGRKRFSGKTGILEYIRQSGCIQFDPVDVCGKNVDLVLLARVNDYHPQDLAELLYKDRTLIDYFDKNLSILPIEDWPLTEETRAWFLNDSRSRELIEKNREAVKSAVRARGFLCSRDLDLKEKTPWFWNDSPLGRVILEALYYRGELVIHHKDRTIKHYSLTEDLIPEEYRIGSSPLSPEDRKTLRVLRRIGAVGMLWNRHSDAFLGIGDLKTPERDRIFSRLIEDGKILPVSVEGIDDPLYVRAEDLPLLESLREKKSPYPRVEFLGPLDPMMWDRKLIKALSGFDYTWEIYTVESKRKYGYYVLPMIYEDRFAGRIECVRDSKTKRLLVKHVWFENGWKPTKAFEGALVSALDRLARLNGCEAVVREPQA